MGKVKVYIDEVEDKGLELVNYSKNNIASTINDLKSAPSNFIWGGLGYQSYILQYNIKMKKLEKINENLSKIAEYLLTVKEGYEDANYKINNTYEELLNEYEELKNELQ